MIINHNISAMNAHRNMGTNSINAGKSMEKLSSGSRINKAGDDAAGLSISEKMRGQIRGLNQASRNIQDGISLVQTAEGGLNEVHSILQRGRELALQAGNDTTTVEDRNAMQAEIKQLTEEVDRIANGTQFNTIGLLNKKGVAGDATVTNIIQGLKSGWLEKAAELVSTHFGLTSTARNLNVVIDEGAAGGTLASINQTWSISGSTATLQSLILNIDKSDFTPSTGADGKNSGTTSGGSMYNDRIIAHEMVHAVMADQMGDAFYDLPTWFKEGTAEFIHGADERLKTDAFLAGGIQNIVDRGADLITGALSCGSTPTIDMSKNYSAGYLTVKYIADNFSGGNDMTTLMDDIQSGIGLEAAITSNTTFTSLADLAGKFKDTTPLAGGGAEYYSTLDIQAVGVSETDTGSIMGTDHLNLGAYDAHSVVATGTYDDTPSNFNVIFPTVDAAESVIEIQLGANSGQSMKVALTDARTCALGIDTLDVVEKSGEAITKLDGAIKSVSGNRAILGAIQNRLAHALQVNENTAENLQAAESRIRDVDMAKEMITLSKNNILSQAAQAILAQANQQPQGVLQLLR